MGKATFENEIKILTDNGVSMKDAFSALLECGGDPDAAAAFQINCVEQGGAHAVVREKHRRSPNQEEVAELENVLKRFEDNSGMNRSSVACVQRVQNLKLWGKYCLRKSEIVEEVGLQAVNEEFLWHGTDMKTLETITRAGFDHRVSNLHCALGAGIYFSTSSQQSHYYASMEPHAASSSPQGLGMPGLGLGHIQHLKQVAFPPTPLLAPAANSLPLIVNMMTPTVQVAKGTDASPNRDYAMLLCRVTLGRVTQGARGMRRPPDGFDSVVGSSSGPLMYAVFDNNQAYPEYLVYYK